MPKVAKKTKKKKKAAAVKKKKTKAKAKAAPKKTKSASTKRDSARAKPAKTTKASAKTKAKAVAKPKPKEPKKEKEPQPEKPLVLKPRFPKKELDDIREQLMSLLTSRREDIVQGVNSASNRDIAHIQDSSDIATDSAEGDLTFRLAESVGVEAAEIERAIEKIDEGTYGYCDVCNKPIPMERLKFLPWASRLVEYQERYELRRKRREEGELEDLDAGDDLSDDA